MFSIIAHHFLFCNNFFVKLFCKILAPVTIPLFSSLRGFSKVSGIERKIWRIVFWEWRGMFRAPFQNPGTSKGLKKCLNAKRHSGQLACGSDNPLAPFNNIFPFLKKFHRIPPKSHATHIPSSRKIHQDIRFASCMLHAGSSVKQNRLIKTGNGAAWRDYHL